MTTPSSAEEQPFVFTYTADIMSQGEAELEQWLGWKANYAHETFRAFESRTEFEYGIADDLQGALYLNYNWSEERPDAPGARSDRDNFGGVSAELIYRVLNAESDPIGLALYVEPTWGAEEHAFEAKILLQKNFLKNALRLAFNINLEDSWDRDEGRWNKGSALEFRAGLAYAIAPDWSLGAEFSNEREFEGLLLGGSSHAQTSAYYLGPAFQFSIEPITVTLGAQAQLPWAGNPSSTPSAVEHGFASSAERYRVLLRFSADL